MKSGEDLVILDVRNEDEYNDWKIEGKTVESINVPYFDFLDEDQIEVNEQKLPKDKEIIVVCAKGGSSEMVAETLQERGYKVYSLEGGMLAWSRFYYPTTVAVDEKMKIIQVNRLSKGCLSYFVVSDGKAMVVDPNQHIDIYLELSEKENAPITTIMDSHLHADHISGAPAISKETGATYYINSSEFMGENPGYEYEPLEQHDNIQFGNINVEVIAIKTPGHTPGSVSFLLNDKYLLSGDTIFVGGLGRPDLGGKAREWALDLYETIFGKISELADGILVLPAHYADIQEINDRGIVSALLGDIRQSNQIMQNATKEEFTEYVAGAANTTKPPNFEDIVAINRGQKQVSQEKADELEIGPNRCAVHHTTQ
ncbi:MAG: MBL fold metallo-hydrolase [Bacillaceae bacterium]|nr:MBL fold metallo-hydrolase [Bacillaceae bacterium]